MTFIKPQTGKVDTLHSALWQAAPRHAEWHILALLIVGLALDARFGWLGQLVAGIWAFGVFLWLMRHGEYMEKRTLLACLVIATAGELICSLVWGLYDYQFNNVPIFVPPGHALLMTLGILYSRRLPHWMIWATPLATLPYVVAGWWKGWDTTGILLLLAFTICLLCGRAKRLYATMFLLSLLLELYGTWLGNWTWRPTVPLTPLTTSNPPICAGTFYCILDLLVLSTLSLLIKRNIRTNRSIQTS